MKFYIKKKTGSSNLTGWKLKVGVASNLFSRARVNVPFLDSTPFDVILYFLIRLCSFVLFLTWCCFVLSFHVSGIFKQSNPYLVP